MIKLHSCHLSATSQDAVSNLVTVLPGDLRPKCCGEKRRESQASPGNNSVITNRTSRQWRQKWNKWRFIVANGDAYDGTNGTTHHHWRSPLVIAIVHHWCHFNGNPGAMKWRWAGRNRHMVAEATVVPSAPLVPMGTVGSGDWMARMGIHWRPMATMAPLGKMVPMDYQCWQRLFNSETGDPLAHTALSATMVPMDRQWCQWCQ